MKLKIIFCLVFVLSGGLFDCFNFVLAADEMDTNHWSGALTLHYTNSQGMVTKKIIPREATNGNVSTSFIATNFGNFISSVTNEEQTNMTPDEKKLLTFANTNSTMMAEFLTLGFGAEEFMGDLKNQGRLPGVAKDGHGDGNLDVPFTSDLSMLKIKYPFSLTFNYVAKGDSLTNNYTFVQSTKDSAWQLQRAWRTDSQGRVIKEWPVKQP
jgi:hypothetical protein